MLATDTAFSAREFDYIIIGGGTAGLVVATRRISRLAEDPNILVGVIEAGKHFKDLPGLETPGLAGSLINDKDTDWCFKTVPQLRVNNRVLGQARGKALGGSSAINLLIAGRANREEYDAFENLGNEGWNWPEFLKYFKKSETLQHPTPEFSRRFQIELDPESHGSDGPLKTSYPKYTWDLHHPFVEALKTLGIPNNTDPAAGNNVGASFSTSCIDPDTVARSYSTNAYYEPNSHRENLIVLTEAQATRVILETENNSIQATGVEFCSNGKTLIAKAKREVILCAGSFQTPHLLELSGIGKREILAKYDIPCLVDLPVGENLQDHIFVTSVFETHHDWETTDNLKLPEERAKALGLYEATREGPLSSTHSPYCFISLPLVVNFEELATYKEKMAAERSYSSSTALSRQLELIKGWIEDPGHAAIELIQRPQMRIGSGDPEPGKKYQTIMTCLMHPLSRGAVHIQSSDPLVPPAIDPAYLHNPLDLDILVSSLKFASKVAATEPLASTIVKQISPPLELQTYDELAEYAKENLVTTFHPVATASMLPREDGGIVDGHLRVYGTSNLRVIDASIIPLELSAHIQTTVYAIAEKGADLIKGV